MYFQNDFIVFKSSHTIMETIKVFNPKFSKNNIVQLHDYSTAKCNQKLESLAGFFCNNNIRIIMKLAKNFFYYMNSS